MAELEIGETYYLRHIINSAPSEKDFGFSRNGSRGESFVETRRKNIIKNGEFKYIGQEVAIEEKITDNWYYAKTFSTKDIADEFPYGIFVHYAEVYPESTFEAVISDWFNS